MRIRAANVALALICSSFGLRAELRAGAGKTDITPPANAFPMTAPPERDFVGVHDPVFARALVLDDGARRTAIVSLEVTIVPEGEKVVAAVAEAANVPVSSVLLFATHTHNNPLVFYHGHDATPAQRREIDRVRDGAVAATREARAHLQAARIAFARGKGWVNVNNGEDAGFTNGFDPSGPSDKTLDVIRVSTATGAPLALLVNYASHAEVMFRSVTKNGGYEVSGDLPGAVSRLLEGPAGAPVVLYSPSAEADQLPLFKSSRPAEGKLPAVDAGPGGWALLDVLARRLAVSVEGVTAAMPAGASDARIDAGATSVSCPGQALQIDHDNGKATASDRPNVDIPLSLIRIGNLTLAGVGGDLGGAIGQNVRQAFPGRDAVVMTMLAGSIGYVLPDSSYAHPGHGLMGSSLKAGCAEKAIVNGLKGLAR